MDKDRLNGIIDKHTKKIKTGMISSNISLSYTVCDTGSSNNGYGQSGGHERNKMVNQNRFNGRITTNKNEMNIDKTGLQQINNNINLNEKRSNYIVDLQQFKNNMNRNSNTLIKNNNNQVRNIKDDLQFSNNSNKNTGDLQFNSNTAKDTNNSIPTNKSTDDLQFNNNPIAKKKKICMKIKSNGMVEATAGCKELAEYLSSNNCNYNTRNGSWQFDTKHYDTVVRILKSNRIPYDGPAQSMVSFIHTNKKEENKPIKKLIEKGGETAKSNFSAALRTNPLYNTTLLPFQKTAVEFVVSRNGRAILGDDMGLGKTLQALTLALHYKLEWPLLIVAPASLLHNWHSNVEKHLGIVPVLNKPGSPICILSFDCATKYSAVLLSTQPGVVIVDECHALKSNTTLRTKSLLPLLQGATRLLLLSGTPAVSKPVELFPLFRALHKSIFSSFDSYCVRYCNQRIFKGFRNNNGCSNAEELNYLLSIVMIRRMKTELKVEIPKKNRSVFILEDDNELVQGESEDVSLDESDIDFLMEHSRIDNQLSVDTNKMVENNSKMVENNNKMVEDNNKIVVDNSKMVENNNKIVVDNSKIVVDNNKMVEDNNKMVEDNSKIVENNSKMVENNNKMVEDNSKIVENNSKMVENNNKIVEDNYKMVEDNSKKVENNKKMVEDNNKMVENLPPFDNYYEKIIENKCKIIENNGKIVIENNNVVKSDNKLVENLSIFDNYCGKKENNSKIERDIRMDEQLSIFDSYCGKIEMDNGKIDRSNKIVVENLSIFDNYCGKSTNKTVEKLPNLNGYCSKPDEKLSILNCNNKEIGFKMNNCNKKEVIVDPNANSRISSDNRKTIQEYFENAMVKIPLVCQFLDTMLSKDVKFIVFAHHSSMMEGVSNYLTSKDVKFIRIEGGTLCSNRAVFVNQFQNDETTRVAVLSLTAANTGLTLTAAKAVVFAELYWNPGTLLQAEDRVHRIGQTECVDIYYLLLKKSVEERIWPSLIKKMKVLESLGISSEEYQKVK